VRNQRIMWTVLPQPAAAVTDTVLRLSVVVSPRLRTDEQLPRPTLQLFPDFVDWPATLRGVRWVVNIDGTSHSAKPGKIARSDLWTELFAAKTFVRPEVFTDLSGERVHSYPAATVTSFLLDRYAAVAATSPTEYPTVDWLRGPDGLGPITFDPGSLAQAEETVEELLQAHQAVPPRPADPPVDFHQLRRFLRPRGQALVDVEPMDPDFHEVVAMTADHPALQRLLGLVIDLELPLDVLQNAGPKPLLTLEPHWAPTIGDSADQTPGLRCIVDDDGVLRAIPPESGARLQRALRRGKLLLAKDLFDVIQIDQDGAAVKVVALALNLALSAVQPTVGQPDRQALPALRSAGFAIAQRGRASDLVRDLARSRDLYTDTDAGGQVELDGGDVIRGFRVDVFHVEFNQWFPLHAREGRYRLPSGNGLKAIEEGTLIASPTSAADGSAGDLFHQETLFHWMGWSLAVRRPGTAISPDESIEQDPASPSDPAYPMDIRMGVPKGSLPRLRFGSWYRFRMRAVDVAGNSIPFTSDPDEDPDFMTEAVNYGRYEPVPAPRIVARQPLTLNEDVDRLVIRSNFDTPATGDAQRHILPTAGAQLLAEHHGRLDTPGRASEVDRGAWADIVKIEGARLEDLPSAQADPARPAETFYDVDALEAPYLPDPLVRGAAFVGLPGAGVVKVEFAAPAGKPWYETRACRVVLQEGIKPSSVFDSQRRELRVALPKGTTFTTRLSSFVNEADLSELGIWHLLAQQPAAVLDELRQVLVEGRHWMITPHRPLTFVHAIRQPLTAPRFGSLEPIRNPGDTYAEYQAPTQLHRSSTARVDVLAEWTEIVDSGRDSPDPALESFRALAFTHVVTETGNAQADTLIGRHEFGDTRHRRVEYTATATSRFVAYFARQTQHRLTGTTPQVLDGAGLVRNSVTVGVAAGQYAEGRDYVLDLVAGTIARTVPSGMPSGQLVTVRYTALPVTRVSENPAVRDVPSTARPPAPAVRYAVPAFSWSRIRVGDVVTSRRTGNALRVYLDRPWYASGDGEVLGVVIERSPAAPKPASTRDRLDTLTTLMGEDPVFRTAGTLSSALSTASFPGAVTTGTDLHLEGSPENVDVAGHSVAFDAGRGLWFCDILVAPGRGYAPLIRPALVRYQPDSLANLHLSPLVLLDFLPLLPDREVRVERISATTYAVAVTGPSYLSNRVGASPTRFVVTAEEQNPVLPGEIGWTAAQTGVVLQAASPGQSGSPRVWSGQVELPARAEGDLVHWRLLVEEFERLNSAATDDSPTVSERLAFLDTIPLAP
jgi:hypothetical protein